MARAAPVLGARTSEPTVPYDPKIDALMDQIHALRAIVQAYEALFLSFTVPKRDIAQAVAQSVKAQKLTAFQQQIVRDLLQSV